jgi:DNA-binding response OmpR family regulator
MDYTCHRERKAKDADPDRRGRGRDRALPDAWSERPRPQVVCAYDGKEGTRLAVDEPVDLVLLDISLPRLDGREVLKRIRLRRPDLPILMLTARDDTRNKVAPSTQGPMTT